MKPSEITQQIVKNVRLVIKGKDPQIESILCCWLAGGHVLIEDLPGTGKTILARALAASVQVDFKRVQFTPDLLPSDILGSSIFNQKDQSFHFAPGPLFTTCLLADEINRATPRTQSALLEAMGERQVSVDGVTHTLDPDFLVLGTQNPIEQHGTFPLPEAQLDRFMMKISMGYPSLEEEMLIVSQQNGSHPISSLKPVIQQEHFRLLRAEVSKVKVPESVLRYATEIVHRTRKRTELKAGAGPRATIALVRAAQARALIEGLGHIQPSHIFQLVKPVVAHRLVLNAEAKLQGLTRESILDGICQEMRVPMSA